MGLSIKQRVKVNAALSMIYAQGYNAQTVVAWAKDYVGMGHTDARAYQMALNEFAAGQPDLGVSLGKITRLVEASDVPTIAKYDVALSHFIETGDDSKVAALAPMMARDSVALAVKNGELPEGALTGEAVEAALGFALADDHVTQAASPAAPQDAPAAAPQGRPEDVYSSQPSATQAQRMAFPGFNSGAQQAKASGTDRHVSATPASGMVVNPGKREGIGWTGSIGSRGLLAGHRVGGDNGISDRPAPINMSKAQIRANYANAGPSVPSETI